MYMFKTLVFYKCIDVNWEGLLDDTEPRRAKAVSAEGEMQRQGWNKL